MLNVEKNIQLLEKCCIAINKMKKKIQHCRKTAKNLVKNHTNRENKMYISNT